MNLSPKAQLVAIITITVVGLGGIVALSVTGHDSGMVALIGLVGPILASLYLHGVVNTASEVTTTDTVRQLANGALTQGVVRALVQPPVVDRLSTLVKAGVHDALDEREAAK